MDTWEIILNALVRILREHLPTELDRRKVKPIAEKQIAIDEDGLKIDDCVFVSFVGDEPKTENDQYVDAAIEYEIEITRFGANRSTARNVCARTKAAVVRVLRDHMGLDANAQAELNGGFSKLEIGRAEAVSGKAKTGGFAHALAFPIECHVRASRREDGSAPDL